MGGVSHSRNFGLLKATGRFVLFVDSDDYLINGWSKIITNAINKQEDFIIFEENAINLKREEMLKSNFYINSNIEHLPSVLSKLYKREFLLENGIKFDEDIINGEDMLFNAKVITKAENVEVINKNIYYINSNQESSTHRFNEKIFESDKKFQVELKKICMENGLDDDVCNKCIENAICLFIRRMSYTNKKEWKRFTYIFNESPYNDFIKKANYFHSKKNKFIISLVKYDKISIAIFVVKNGRKLKRLKDYIIK